VDFRRLVVPDRLSDALDGFSHAAEGPELILSQPTPLPIASRCGEGLFGPSIMMVSVSCVCVSDSVGDEGVPRGSLEPM
jgi:hypothetical protein